MVQTYNSLGESWLTTISMILIFIAQMCGSFLRVSGLGLAMFRSLMDHPSFLSVMGCRMLYHMKEMGASGLQQAVGQTSGGPNLTLAPIEFAEIAQQPGSSAGRAPHARTGVESDIPAWAKSVQVMKCILVHSRDGNRVLNDLPSLGTQPRVRLHTCTIV